MYQKALSIYYSLALFAVGSAVFVMHPSGVPEMAAWQDGVKYDFKVAFIQTIGDRPWFTEVGEVYGSVADFYAQSGEAAIALFSQPEADEDIYYVFSEVYNTFAKAFDSSKSNETIAYGDMPLPPVGSNFMSEEPLYNIVPYRSVVITVDSGKVAGISSDVSAPINTQDRPWVTIQDNLTGQLYCLAIYNGSINKYLGSCKYDYY